MDVSSQKVAVMYVFNFHHHHPTGDASANVTDIGPIAPIPRDRPHNRDRIELRGPPPDPVDETGEEQPDTERLLYRIRTLEAERSFWRRRTYAITRQYEEDTGNEVRGIGGRKDRRRRKRGGGGHNKRAGGARGGGAAGVEVAGGGVTRAEVVAGVEGVDLGADVAEAEVGVEGGLGTVEAVGLEWAVAAPLNAVVLGTLSPSGPYGQGLTPSQPRLMT